MFFRRFLNTESFSSLLPFAKKGRDLAWKAVNKDYDEVLDSLSEIGENHVLIPDKNYLKIHLHTSDGESAKESSRRFGNIIRWSDDNIASQVKNFRHQDIHPAIRIMTDCAASITHLYARELGIILLDSYINDRDKSLPESLYSPEELYKLMRNHTIVTTSQVSDLERHYCYQNVLNHYGKLRCEICNVVCFVFYFSNSPQNRVKFFLILLILLSFSGNICCSAADILSLSRAKKKPEGQTSGFR